MMCGEGDDEGVARGCVGGGSCGVVGSGCGQEKNHQTTTTTTITKTTNTTIFNKIIREFIIYLKKMPP